MARSSAAAALPATQYRPATRNASGVASGVDPLATVADRVRNRVQQIRSTMVSGAPTGFQQRVAALMGCRKERISREKQGAEKLSVELLLAEVALHRAEGRGADADRLLNELIADQPKRTPVIRIRGGQYLLEFES